MTWSVRVGRPRLLAAAAVLRTDIVVLDIGMPLMNGLDGAQLKREMPEVKVTLLTVAKTQIWRLRLSGPRVRYLLKNSAASEFR